MTGRTGVRTCAWFALLIGVFALIEMEGDIALVTAEFGKGMHTMVI